MFTRQEITEAIENTGAIETPNIISVEDGRRLVRELSRTKNNMAEPAAFAAIAIVCQKGGTSKKAQGNISAVVNGITVTLADIRTAMRTLNVRYTMRQWARTFADQIHFIAETYSIPGDLAKKITRNHTELDVQDTYWLSNFQMDNPNCPENIRALLTDHYHSLFGR
jgi:hypothetical protein